MRWSKYLKKRGGWGSTSSPDDDSSHQPWQLDAALDRTLGFGFGLARGLILVVIAYLFFTWLVPEDTQPQWIRDARSLPILKQTGAGIVSLLPEDPAAAIPGINKQEQDTTPPPASTPAPANPDQKSSLTPPAQVANATHLGHTAARQ